MQLNHREATMKTSTLLVSTLCILSSFVCAAESASEHASTASKHAALALGHSTVSAGQVASGIVAVPLLIAGSTASASHAVGTKLIDAASGTHRHSHAPQDTPLEITEITITVDRAPNEAIKNQN